MKTLVYKYPSWYVKYNDPKTVTEKQLLEWEEENQKITKENIEVLEKRNSLCKELANLAEELEGKNSNLYKYIIKYRYSYANDITYAFSRLKENIKAEKQKQEKKKEEDDAASKNLELTIDAIKFLEERGKVKDKDFEVKNAIDIANNVAFQEEVARRIKSLEDSGDYIDFNGNICDGPCEGWDGRSRRCQCGNRRVSWEAGFGFTFKNLDIYAEAY